MTEDEGSLDQPMGEDDDALWNPLSERVTPIGRSLREGFAFADQFFHLPSYAALCRAVDTLSLSEMRHALIAALVRDRLNRGESMKDLAAWMEADDDLPGR